MTILIATDLNNYQISKKGVPSVAKYCRFFQNSMDKSNRLEPPANPPPFSKISKFAKKLHWNPLRTPPPYYFGQDSVCKNVNIFVLLTLDAPHCI